MKIGCVVLTAGVGVDIDRNVFLTGEGGGGFEFLSGPVLDVEGAEFIWCSDNR